MSTHSLATPQARQPLTFPIVLQRLEGLSLLAGAVAIYQAQGFGWGLFALLLLAPDLAALGYLAGSRAGNTSYNLAHTLIFPLGIALLAGMAGQALALQLGLIWLAHIGMDRAVGYGFKQGERATPGRRAGQ